jgi:hypothetical protein
VLNDLDVPGSLLLDSQDRMPHSHIATSTTRRDGQASGPEIATVVVEPHRPQEVPGSGLFAPASVRRIDAHAELTGAAQRRREPRYRAIENRVWVEWWNEGEFTGLSGRMLNVSRGGAMIALGARLRDGQTLQMVLEDSATGVSVEAEVLGSTPVRGGVFQTRLEFISLCPVAFFEAAATGFEAWLAGSGRLS